MTKKRDTAPVNEGIQGSVYADVVAVGHGAQAVKTVTSAADVKQIELALSDLRRAIHALSLNPAAKEAVEGDLKQLEDAAVKPAADHGKAASALESLTGKLKMVGVVVGQAAAIAEPIKKILGYLKLSLGTIGLG